MSNGDIGFLETLEAVIEQRLQSGDTDSYTASLAASGDRRVAQKVGEEGVEVALASVSGNNAELLGEAADLLYHLLVLLNTKGLKLADVVSTLEDRHTG
jgi:phosphoribosyl-ATP pyrophosphohydrolase/phosphoribosyl-AMP cyclohydrolase